MKIQYFGDVNDYRKFALLRILAKEKFKIGVCWMLTEADGNSQGNDRSYIREPSKWRDFDPELLCALAAVPAAPKLADLKRIETEGLIREASFFYDFVPYALEARNQFHRDCLAAPCHDRPRIF